MRSAGFRWSKPVSLGCGKMPAKAEDKSAYLDTPFGSLFKILLRDVMQILSSALRTSHYSPFSGASWRMLTLALAPMRVAPAFNIATVS